MDKNIHYLKWEQLSKILERKNLEIFTLLDLKRLFQVKADTLKRLLSRQVKKKNLIRLKRGLYCLTTKIPNEFVIAGLLYTPSYISLESALSYYSIIPETVYSVTSVTAKQTREFLVLGRSFTYNKIKKEAFGSYVAKRTDDKSFFIATAEKALADYLYFVSLGLKNFNERTDWSRINRKEVKDILLTQFGLAKTKAEKLLS